MKTAWRSWLVASCVMSASASLAQTPLSVGSTSHGTAVGNDWGVTNTGTIAEVECDQYCEVQYTLPLKPGYANGSAVVFLQLYYLRWSQAGSGEVYHARIMVEKNSYNPTTGDITVTASADLQDDATPGRKFQWGVWFTVFAGDNTNAIARTKTLSNFVQAGTGNPCDTTAPCEDSSTLTSVKTSSLTWHAALVRGFDVGTASGNGVKVNTLGFDSTSYSAGTINATGATTCSFESSTAEDVLCEVGLATLSFATPTATHEFWKSSLSGSVSSVSGPNYTSDNGTYGGSKSVVKWLIGLQSTNQSTTSGGDISLGRTSAGTGASSLNSGPPIFVNTQGTFDFATYTTNPTYNASYTSYLGFIY